MKSFTLIFLFFYANISFAFGLGDAELKSHLGEKLVVKINLAEIDSGTDSACFLVSDVSEVAAFKKTNIALKQVNGGDYQLLISSKEIINEPIVNLRVSAQCEHNTSRDYVLLLDPAASISFESESGLMLSQEKSKIRSVDTQSTGANLNGNNIPSIDLTGKKSNSANASKLNKPANHSRKSKNISAATSVVDKKLLEAYTGKQQATALNKQAKAPASTDKPYLVISGGSENATGVTNKPNLSLRLETKLDLNRIADTPALLGAEEALDEVTVMTNRLAYLEKQITSLQTRNTQLITAAEKIKEKAKNDKSSFPNLTSNWLNYLLMVLGFVSAVVCVEWLRRRLVSKRLERDQAKWFDNELVGANTGTASSSMQKAIQPEVADVFGTENHLLEPNYNAVNAFDSKASTSNVSNEDNENILDHVEVFIAHDRPMLAIQLLQNYLGDFPKESPAIWLKLLKLLAKEDAEAEYDLAVLECKQFFNINMPSFSDAARLDTSSVEDYPHIITRLKDVWGSPFAISFLHDLIYNQNSQPREGFERNTFEELFFLMKIAECLYPDYRNVEPRNAEHKDIELQSPAFQNQESANQNLNSKHTALTRENIADKPVPQAISAISEQTAHLSEADDEVEMLVNADKILSFNKEFNDTHAEVKPTASNGMFYADEIDFSAPAYEIDFETTSNLIDEKIVLNNDSFIVQEPEDTLKRTMLKNEPAKKNKSKKPDQENLIDWDLPDNLSKSDLK